MDNFYARTVFFVKDGEAALAFYTQKLGFQVDWTHLHEGRPFVFQVSLFGFELILNQVWGDITDRAGHGRLFIGLEEDQGQSLLQHIRDHAIAAKRDDWGRPTLVILDPDGNELYFWLHNDDWAADVPPLRSESS